MKKNYLISFFIGNVFNIINIIFELYNQIRYLKSPVSGYNLECPYSIYNTFILVNTNPTLTRYYLYSIPIISSIVCLDDYTPVNRTIKSFIKKSHIYFFKGFLITFSTIIFSLIMNFAFFPAISPEISTGYFPLGYRGSFLFQLYIKNPLMYIIVFSILYSIFSGMFSVIGNAVYLITEKKFIVPFINFLINISVSRLFISCGLETLQLDSLFIPIDIYIDFSFTKYIEYFILMFALTCLIITYEVIFRKAIEFENKKARHN